MNDAAKISQAYCGFQIIEEVFSWKEEIFSDHYSITPLQLIFSFHLSIFYYLCSHQRKKNTKHYGFTEEELDFIINYDIKYRMGDELNENE